MIAGEHHFQATFALRSLAAIIPFTHLQKLSTYLRVLMTPRSPTNIVPRLIVNKPAQYCPPFHAFCLRVCKYEACTTIIRMTGVIKTEPVFAHLFINCLSAQHTLSLRSQFAQCVPSMPFVHNNYSFS